MFCNPPYNDLETWLHKCVEEAQDGAEVVVMLIPMWSDRTYWHEYAMEADEMWMIQGRVPFLINGEKKANPTYPSVVLVFYDLEYDYPYVRQVRDWKNSSLEGFGQKTGGKTEN